MIISKLDVNGSLYLLLIEENLKVLSLLSNMKLSYEVVMKREVMRERQLIIKACYKSD